jgi:hypothetical protein
MSIAAKTYNQVVDVVASGQRVEVRALNDWNGFNAGGVYELHSGAVEEGVLAAVDEHGIFSRIHPPIAAEHFELVDELPEPKARETIPMHVRLASLAGSLLEPQEPFKVGDLVINKCGLSNRQVPADTQPAVVTEIFEAPLTDDEFSSSTPYFHEPLTMKIGVLTRVSGTERFIELCVDGRRFRHYDPEIDQDYDLPEQKRGLGHSFTEFLAGRQ